MAANDRAIAARALRDTGKYTLDDIAEMFGVAASTVHRWLEATPSDDANIGPAQHAAQAVIDGWGPIDAQKGLFAQALLIAASIADQGRSTSNGALANSAVAAVKEIRSMLEDTGQGDGVAELMAALRDGV